MSSGVGGETYAVEAEVSDLVSTGRAASWTRYACKSGFMMGRAESGIASCVPRRRYAREEHGPGPCSNRCSRRC